MKKLLIILASTLLLAGCNSGETSSSHGGGFNPGGNTTKTTGTSATSETSTTTAAPKDRMEVLLSDEVIATRDEKLSKLKSFKISMTRTNGYRDGMTIVEKDMSDAEATFDETYVPDYAYVHAYNTIKAGTYGEQPNGTNLKTLYLAEEENYMGYSYGTYSNIDIDNSSVISYDDFMSRVTNIAETLRNAPRTREALKAEVLKVNLNNEYFRVVKEETLSTYVEEHEDKGYFLIGVRGTYKFDDEYMSLHTVNNYWFKFTYEGILLSARSDISISDTRYQKYTLDIKYDEDVAKQTPESIRN